MIKKALVTGASSGIGNTIALDLASKGFDVAFHYQKSLEAAKDASQKAQSYGVKSIFLGADVTNPDEAQSIVERTVEELGGLSVVVNNVGNYLDKPTSQLSVEEWHEMINSNLNATFYVTKAALPYLKAADGGRIVNIGCARAKNVLARYTNTPYLIAKTGIIIYSKYLAKELIIDKITVNVVSPGIAENSYDIEDYLPQITELIPA
jgi:3-oxoacyl-[acyl-carrier protein] reductase